MKTILKTFSVVFAVVTIFSFASCATAIQFNNKAERYKSNAFSEQSEIAFIGFKADNSIMARNDYGSWKSFAQLDSVRNLGSELQANNIADDQSHAYFGLYSLQEIKEFKTDKRYITFVEVTEHSITYTDKAPGSPVGKIIGGIAAGTGLGVLFVAHAAGVPIALVGGAVTLFSSVGKGKCTMKATGEYNIYLYDRQEQRIVTRVTADVNKTDNFVGNWTATDEAGRNEILDYYGTYIKNAILEKYDDVQAWVLRNR